MDISRTLQKLCPNSSYCVNGNSYDGIIWQDETVEKPTLQEVEATWEAIKNNILWEPARDKRDKLLQECDYTQLADFQGNKQAWLNYRTALRDVPQTFGNPESVIWPTKPE
jgi:hypothetical protein